MNRIVLTMMLAVLMTGCATHGNYAPAAYVPVIDHARSTAQAPLEIDLRECNALATQRAGAGSGAVGGALAGLLLGAALGKAAGLDGGDIGRMSRVGAVTGAASGAADGMTTRQSIVANCMAGRGWAVVGS